MKIIPKTFSGIGGASLATKLLIFFAACPDEILNTQDIADKYDTKLPDVRVKVHGLIRLGLLSRVSTGVGRGNMSVYGAGPLLLAEIGRTAREDA